MFGSLLEKHIICSEKGREGTIYKELEPTIYFIYHVFLAWAFHCGRDSKCYCTVVACEVLSSSPLKRNLIKWRLGKERKTYEWAEVVILTFQTLVIMGSETHGYLPRNTIGEIKVDNSSLQYIKKWQIANSAVLIPMAVSV